MQANHAAMAYYSRNLKIPFEDAVTKITENLQLQGFASLLRIDLEEAIAKKLQIKFRKYLILEAYDPVVAYQAVSLESHMGLLLPCTLIVQQHENLEVEVSAINPLENLDPALATEQLVELAHTVGKRLRIAIDELHRDKPETVHVESLPLEHGPVHVNMPLHG
jgi:uncharacterized protein (DUF302 family)